MSGAPAAGAARAAAPAAARGLRVGLVLPRLDAGGPDGVFFQLAGGLAALGLDPQLVVQEPGGHHWELAGRLPRHVVPGLGARAASAYPVRALARTVRELELDVVLCTLRSVLTAATGRALGLIRVPVVIRPANHLSRNAAALLRAAPVKHAASWLASAASLHAADRIVCQSRDMYEDFRRYGVPDRKLSVIGNPVAPAVGGPPASLPGSPALLAVGRLMAQKGFDVLIRALPAVAERLPGVTLAIAGDGPDRSALAELAARAGVAERVHFLGFRADVRALMRAADLVVSASRYEGFPNVLLEALAEGTPVVATDCPGGTREIVSEGVTGWLCRAESEAELAAAIVRGAAGREALAGEPIRRFAEETFSLERIAARYAEVLSACTGGRE